VGVRSDDPFPPYILPLDGGGKERIAPDPLRAGAEDTAAGNSDEGTAVIQLAIKVDVDTWIGLKEGVPNLLALFQRYAVPASFFIAFGPDNSGKAIRRIFKPGFLQKMWRTNPLRLYGLKTLLCGIVLPPPIIGEMAPELLQRVLDEGHELGIHGYDHVLWQDRLERLGEAAIAREIDSAIAIYAKALKASPQSFAAPGWQANRVSLAVQDRLRFLYCSDTRGAFPFMPTMQGQAYQTPQIPTTLPTLDEVLGLNGMRGEGVNQFFRSQLRPHRLNVHTIHAEVEGRAHLDLFESLLRGLEAQGVTYARLCDVAKQLRGLGYHQLPRSSIQLRPVPGRAGEVACQVVDDRT
jgi:undecaprenyl phosphate-alpha-L-ara4FN deformylase